MNRSFLLLLLAFVCLVGEVFESPVQAQVPPEPPPSHTSVSEAFSWADTYGKSPTQFSVSEWHDVIDATWGEGVSTDDKVKLFDRWWKAVNIRYGGFHNSDVDIVALRDKYRPEIEGGVSRGRFAGIMSHFTYQLNELHTYLIDVPVRNTPMNKGVPLFVVGQWGTNRHFGAVLTPLPDSSLLVYNALSNHPIGLQPGDLVLGYDGVPWKDIYPTLLEAELPLFLNSVNASTDEANTYYLLQAAGLNWHLFDTIDIVKYSTGDTLHFPTSQLAGQNRTIWGSEQVDVPGVSWPNRSRNDRVGWGVVEGTKVGYIYVTSWSFEAQFRIRDQFREAVDSLMHHSDTEGIIFDFRFNTGGGALGADGFRLLFNERVPTVGFDQRINSAGPLDMEPDPLRPEWRLVIQGDENTYYDKPIAILIGPGSISAGELEARRLSFHPRARIFGKTAPGGNTGSDFIGIGDSDWFVSLTTGSMYLVSTHQYLAHIGLKPDEPVWFTQTDVANGIDTVVEAALSWIDSETPTDIEEPTTEEAPASFRAHAYPNPARSSTTIRFDLRNAGHVKVELFNVVGQRVATLMNSIQMPGQKQVVWDGRGASGQRASTGHYFYRIQTATATETGAVLFLQ